MNFIFTEFTNLQSKFTRIYKITSILASFVNITLLIPVNLVTL